MLDPFPPKKAVLNGAVLNLSCLIKMTYYWRGQLIAGHAHIICQNSALVFHPSLTADWNHPDLGWLQKTG